MAVPRTAAAFVLWLNVPVNIFFSLVETLPPNL